MKILNQYEKDGICTTEYSIDGETVSHIVKASIQKEFIEQALIEEQILAENHYQTALLEVNMMGAI